MKKKNMSILVVDDDPDILEIIKYNLTNEDYKIHTAKDGLEAIEKAKDKRPNLILLDVMMPEMDGIEACEKIREIKGLDKTVVAFLTARGEDYSQVAGFEAGADDYITKPIKPKLLSSKVKALLRRFLNEDEAKSIYKVGNLTINKDEYKVTLKDEVVSLPRKEFELLSLLTSEPEKVFKREDILNTVWGSEVVVGGRTIDVHVRKLREKIGSKHFKTVKGVGYKFVV